MKSLEKALKIGKGPLKSQQAIPRGTVSKILRLESVTTIDFAEMQ